MAEIYLRDGISTTVDNDLYGIIMSAPRANSSWWLKQKPDRDTMYARCRLTIGDDKMTDMQNFIWNLFYPEYVGTVDHIDFNGLNNVRSNLRAATWQQNGAHRRKQDGTTSQYKGVSWDKKSKKWKAYIKVDYKTIHLGYFVNEEDAARAYNCEAAHSFGPFAVLNDVTPLFTTYVPKYPCKGI